MGGRLVPAEAVPVDMASEQLVVRLTRYQPPRQMQSYADYYFARGDVEVTYTLRADRKVTIPIVFPVINEPRAVQFELNGAAVPTTVTSDLQLYPAYEQDWVAAIERFISGDRTLAGLQREARELRARQPATANGPARPAHDPSTFMRLFSRVQRRLDELQVPDTKTLGWAFTHYLIGDWELPGIGGEHLPADFGARRKLCSERLLALAVDPTVPDPAALWCEAQTGMLPNPAFQQQVCFISARLRLRRGDNQFAVRYQQPISFTNVRYAKPQAGGIPGPSHKQASVFEFILRTARFWRSFGSLNVSVQLPPGTIYADCNLSGASVSLSGAQPSVTYSASGLPDQNLSVAFADFKVLSDPRDDQEPFRGETTAVSTMALTALWDRPLNGRMFLGSAPAVDDKVVVAGGEGQLTICDRSTGEVLKEMTLPGRARKLLLLPDAIVVGLEVKSQGGYEKPGAGLVCFDRGSYAQRWSQTVTGADYRSYDTQPLQAGGTIVAWADRGPVFAVDAASGKLLWQQPGTFRGLALSADGSTAYLTGVTAAAKEGAPSHGATPAPLAAVLATDVKTGKIEWRTPAGYEAFGPTIWGDKLVFTGMNKRYAEPFVACLDRANGQALWKKPLGERGPRYNAVFTTRVRGNRLLVFHDGGIDAYDLEHPPAIAWRAGFRYQLYTAPVIAEGYAYAPGRLGGLQKFDLTSGKMVQELTCTRSDGAATIAGDQLFTLEFSGLLTAWSLAGRAPRQAPAAPAAGWPGTPPADLAARLASTSTPGRNSATGTLARGHLPITVFAIVGLLLLGAITLLAFRHRKRTMPDTGTSRSSVPPRPGAPDEPPTLLPPAP
jgi:hypothetical protein